MSALEHDFKKTGVSTNYSALNLNQDFLRKLKDAGVFIRIMIN